MKFTMTLVAPQYNTHEEDLESEAATLPSTVDLEEKEYIDQYHDGNEDEFDAELMQGRYETFSWKDMMEDLTEFPELEDAEKELILNRLGYLPQKHVTIVASAKLRQQIHEFRSGKLSESNYQSKVDYYIKQIRNRDLFPNSALHYDDDIYRTYWNIYTPHRQKAKDRLTGFLGYEPALEHSIVAELTIQDLLSNDTFELPDDILPVDFKAITIIRYREVLLAEGKDAADDSTTYGVGPYTV